MPYQHKPMNEILAPTAEVQDEAPTADPAAAAQETAKEAPALPEKYAGKTTEQVIEMHQNAESRLGQLQNEVGSLRGVVSDLSQLKRSPAESETEVQEPVTVSGDDLISDPVEAITRVVKPLFDAQNAKTDANRIDALVVTEGTALLTEFGDVGAIVDTPEFIEFANRTASRQADLAEAAKPDASLSTIRAGRRLLEDFADFQKATAPKETGDTPVETARKVATESGGAGGPVSAKSKIFEADVVKLINGSAEDLAKYRSSAFQKELTDAIKEGRYVAG